MAETKTVFFNITDYGAIRRMLISSINTAKENK